MMWLANTGHSCIQEHLVYDRLWENQILHLGEFCEARALSGLIQDLRPEIKRHLRISFHLNINVLHVPLEVV